MKAGDPADRWILPLRGSVVVSVDWTDQVQFRLAPAASISVGTSALFSRGPASAPGAEVASLEQLGQDAVFACVGSKVLSAVGFKNGALRIVFDNAWHLNVRAGEIPGTVTVTVGDSLAWPPPRVI